MTNIMAILLVAPLSAGLLSLEDVQISRNEQFNRLQPFRNGTTGNPLKLQDTATDETYFRTISSVVQNLTTSAWLSDTHAVLPFWPAGFNSIPFSASLAGAPQHWKGHTSVCQVGLQCTSMELTTESTSDSVYYWNINTSSVFMSILEMNSADGCSVRLNISPQQPPPGGGRWSNTTTENYPCIEASPRPIITVNDTSACGTREMFFIASPLMAPQTNQSVAQLYSTKYFIAFNVTTTVENTATSFLVGFDGESFNEKKVAIDHSLVDLQNLEDLFLNQRWNAYFQPPYDFNNSVQLMFGGPLILLAALLGDTGFF